MIRIQDIKLNLKEDKSKLKEEILKALNIKEEYIISYSIFKESIDARKKNDIHFVYTVDVEVSNEDKILKKSKNKKISISPIISYDYVNKGEKNISKRPVIVGMGPAGLFAGLILAQMGYKPILLERGKAVEERAIDVELFWNTGKLNTESNVQFGEGGAGTFSDGKLNTLIKDPRSRKVLEEFVVAGAPEDILYKNKPHIGTDILRNVVANIRKTIISLGGEVRFQSKVTDLIIEDEKVTGVIVNNNDTIYTDILILALGHSARDTFQMLYNRQLSLVQKAFSIGVRIEHPQEIIDKSQYGDFAKDSKLGAADYKLSGHFDNGRSAYTFCMCPGGEVVAAASEENRLVTNGMSYHARDKENANSALLVGITPEDFGSPHPLAGVEFQRRLEEQAFQTGGGDYTAPAQLVGDFLRDIPSEKLGIVKATYAPKIKLTDLRECLPGYVVETIKKALPEFNKKIEGFAHPDAIMTGVESRSSSPVRIQRDNNYESNIKGIYPVGEGAGYAGGIISAAVDGIRIAEQIASE
ncbi:FAD-dependent protein [Tissierella sp.]|uniref:NAD(P)/FAD-dependent oxidoreductase n=1 Tax=Tissierella sp. TaxID=41274 RepID=UPI002859ED22|nr:hypothetical protein [Tissierella sp.]MDR7857676.1 hypothetical protein [Tissierella sp.]